MHVLMVLCMSTKHDILHSMHESYHCSLHKCEFVFIMCLWESAFHIVDPPEINIVRPN